MTSEISLGDNLEPEKAKPNTGIRYDRKGSNYGLLIQDIYSTGDIAKVLGVNSSTILEHIKNGKLKARYLGGPAGYRITKTSIINWIQTL